MNLNACMAYPETEDPWLTRNSMEFHRHMGYVMAGEFHQCGGKFGRWYNMVWMEKLLGEHLPDPESPIAFPALGEELLTRLGLKPPCQMSSVR